MPELRHVVFPDTPALKSMIDAVSQIGILLLLLLTGMETNLVAGEPQAAGRDFDLAVRHRRAVRLRRAAGLRLADGADSVDRQPAS